MADIEKRVPVMRHRIQVGVAMATAQTAPLHPPPPIHTHTPCTNTEGGYRNGNSTKAQHF